MAQRVILTTNYDFIQKFQLYRAGNPFDMADATLVMAALIDPADGEIILDATEQTDTVAGAEWATSLIAVHFDETATLAIEDALINKYGTVGAELMIEIRVELDGISEAWQHRPVFIEKGYIAS